LKPATAMSFPLDRLYPIIVLTVLLGGTIWLERITNNDSPAVDDVREEPDFIAEESRTVRFDQQGRQRYELIADKITHYPAVNISQLQQPRLRYDVDQRVLQITARYGEVRRDGEEVFLSGDVSVVRTGLPDEESLTLTSSTLTVWPDTEQAATDDPVVLTRGTTVARGDAMRADNLFGTLNLLGSTSIHMPSSSQNTP